MNYVIKLVISYLSMFVYLSYHVSCWPWLAITVSLISPVYKINQFNTICRLTRTYTEPWVLAKDREPWVLARDRVSEIRIRLWVELSLKYLGSRFLTRIMKLICRLFYNNLRIKNKNHLLFNIISPNYIK